MDRVRQMLNRLRPDEALEVTAALEKYRHAGRLAAEMTAHGRTAQVEKRHKKLLVEANWILVHIGREHGVKFRDEVQKVLDEEMTKTFLTNVRSRQWKKNPAPAGDLDEKARRIKVLAKLAARADARGERKKASEYVRKAREIWLPIGKVNQTAGMKLFDVGMGTYHKELKRRGGKNPPREWKQKPPVGTPITYKLRRDRDWQEWQVVAMIGGKKWEPYTYYAGDDKKDAQDTMAALKRDYPVVLNKYMGFKKLTATLKKRGARSPKRLAAWIGRKKYGKKEFQAMAAKGRRAKARKKSRVLHFPYKSVRGKRKTAANRPKKKLGLALIALYGIGAYFLYSKFKKS